MMHCGLPLLTTLGTEISQQIADLELGLWSPTRDVAAFAEKLIWAARNRRETRGMAEKVREFVRDELSYVKTTEELRSWAPSPRRAPDLGERARPTDDGVERGKQRDGGKSSQGGVSRDGDLRR